MMELKNYNDITKYVVPLLGEVQLKDLLPETGFVNAYVEDGNRLCMTGNYIFLLYKSSCCSNWEGIELYGRMKSYKSLYSITYRVINKEHYMIYTFPIIENAKIIKDFIKYRTLYDGEAKYKILKFWDNPGIDVSEIKNYIFYTNIERKKNFIAESIPEDDPSPCVYASNYRGDI